MFDQNSIRENFEKSCESYSQKRGIRGLSKKLLERCMEIPKEGITIKYGKRFKEVYKALIISESIDAPMLNYLGGYSINNGYCLFVNADGRTFLTKDPEVIKALENGNYIKRDWFVPLSEEGEIEDEKFSTLWENLTR